MTYSENSKQWTNNYRQKKEQIVVVVEKGERQRIADHAAAQGESTNAFIKRAINEAIDNDNHKKRN